VRDKDLCGIVAASLTPVTAALEIDAQRLSTHVAGLLGSGCSYVSAFGTTGEGASFSIRQKIDALDALIVAGIDPARLLPGVMSPTIDDAAAMLDALDRFGCPAAVVLPPFYYGASQEGVAAFYGAVFDRMSGSGIGVVLYNIPQLSRVAFERGLVAGLRRRHGGRIVGLKDSTGSRDNAVMLAEAFPDLSIFVGDDRVLPDAVAAGGAGLIGGLPNLFAPDLVALYQALSRGEDTQNLMRRATARIEAVVDNGDLLALKAVLARSLGDPQWARTMPPLMPITESQADEVERIFAATGYTYGAAA
jgi:4-hydroxy-tetrahydrodipicolinate synthase